MQFLELSPSRAAAVGGAFLALLLTTLVALPSSADAASVSSSISKLQQAGLIDLDKANSARRSYRDARVIRRRLKGSRRTAMNHQIRTVERLARKNRITADRVTPLFETLKNNADWFKKNGPARTGTDRRFKRTGRIIFQYFAGNGWEFHPLSNFSKLNAVWTDKSAPARRALGKYAHELIAWGVNRSGALTWEYYFPFAGSSAPFISSISQGTAIQALARAGNATADPTITQAAQRAVHSFDVRAPHGLKVQRNPGYHYVGYSGNRRTLILNMFLQSLDGLHDYSIITDDQNAWRLYREGLKAARRDTRASDTGAWSLYSVRGRESTLSYHNLVTGFLEKLCGSTKETIFCATHTNFVGYRSTKPKIRSIKKRVKGRRIHVYFKLSKISTVKLEAKNGGTTIATVGRGKRRFSVKRGRSRAIKLTATDLAGNRVSVRR